MTGTDPAQEATAAIERKDYRAAIAAIIAHSQNTPLQPRHYLIKGLAELALQQWTDAVATFTAAAKLSPQQPQLWFNLGMAQENLGQLKEAAISYETSLALQKSGEAYGNLSNIYRRLGRFAEAERTARAACDFATTKPQALNSLGLALMRQGKFAAAETAFQSAHHLDPDNPDILANQANLAIDRLDFAKAWPLFAAARSTSDSPIFRRDEGMARLLAGDYGEGWKLFEARLELPTALRLRPACPRYTGPPLNGKKLLLLAEQGLGDTIMFSRYSKCFAEQGAELIWAVQPALKTLLANHLPGQIFTETEPLPAADFYLPLMSAPVTVNRPEPFSDGSYLKPPATPFLPPARHKLKLGLVASGSRTHERDHERSIPLQNFIFLFEKIPADFYALNPDTPNDPANQLIPLHPLIKTFADTAALLSQLDALVTVDTATAHLAGALGVKTYLLLPYCPDWRWGMQGDTTAWYPGMKLLRQKTYGDWKTVIDDLITELGDLGR